mmetsp:Transcript_19369/g.33235  ORF Transcript_19369/g.33235 Transcript_19369/m.33235 type:complete len:84 (+) Transcript_19369:164-415(+)
MVASSPLPIPPCDIHSTTEIADEEWTMQKLSNERANLTTAMTLLHQDTKENRTKLILVNAEMHKSEQRLKRLHSLRGEIAADI